MAISFGGVAVPLPTQEFLGGCDLIGIEEAILFQRPSVIHDSWNHPGEHPHTPVKIGSLFWPTGAARFARAHLICSESKLAKIRPQAYSANYGFYQALPFIMEDGTGDPTHQIKTNLFMLPPKPLTQITGVDTIGEPIWLITLVDDRYFWWEKTATITISGGTTTWANLFSSIGTALGVSIATDTISSAYLKPGESLSASYEFLPLLLDAVCENVGQKFIRKLDGSCTTQNPLTAKAMQDNQALSFPRRQGGRYAFNPSLPNDLNGLVPATFTLVFPKTEAGIPSSVGFPKSVTLASLSLAEFAGVHAHSGTHFVNDTCTATMTLVGDATPTNNAELVALATQQATDWYRWRLGRCSLAYAGVVPWTPEGMSDFVEWMPLATRIERPPLSDLSENYNRYGAGGDLIEFGNGIPIVYAPGTDTINSYATAWNITSGAWTWAAGSTVNFNGSVFVGGVPLDQCFLNALKCAVVVTVTSLGAAYTRTANVITADANGLLGNQDGVTQVVGNRILLRSGNSDAGIYTVTTMGSGGTKFTLTRAVDMNTSAMVSDGCMVEVQQGTIYAESLWVLSTNNPIVLNSDIINFCLLAQCGASTVTNLTITGGTVTSTTNTWNLSGDTWNITAGAWNITGGTWSWSSTSDVNFNGAVFVGGVPLNPCFLNALKCPVLVKTDTLGFGYTRTGNVITASANGAMPNQDDVVMMVGDRMLLRIGGGASVDNGIWTVTSLGSGGTPAVLTRATDMNTSAMVKDGCMVEVQQGTVDKESLWVLSTNDAITLNTTAIDFCMLAQCGATAAYTDEQAQDAIGAMLVDSATINATYNDAGNTETLDVITDSLTAGFLHASATDKLFGRSTAGAGAGEEIPCTAAARALLAAATPVAEIDLLHTQGADVASAATLNLSTATGDYVVVTGTTAITSLTSQTAGQIRRVTFAGALTLTHNATSLKLPGAANIITAAGDRAEFLSLGGGNWECRYFVLAAAAVPPLVIAGVLGTDAIGASPRWFKASKTYADFTSGAAAKTLEFGTLAANVMVHGTMTYNPTTFSGGGVATCTCSVGTSAPVNTTTRYQGATDCKSMSVYFASVPFADIGSGPTAIALTGTITVDGGHTTSQLTQGVMAFYFLLSAVA